MTTTIKYVVTDFASASLSIRLGYYQFQRLFNRPCKNRFVANLDDRTLQKARLFNNLTDNLIVGRIFC